MIDVKFKLRGKARKTEYKAIVTVRIKTIILFSSCSVLSHFFYFFFSSSSYKKIKKNKKKIGIEDREDRGDRAKEGGQ